jgi:hypothetical protein
VAWHRSEAALKIDVRRRLGVHSVTCGDETEFLIGIKNWLRRVSAFEVAVER